MPRLQSPEAILRRIAYVAVFSIAAGLGLPTLTNWIAGTLFDDEVKEIVSNRPTLAWAAKELTEYDKTESSLLAQRKAIEARIALAAASDQPRSTLPELVATRHLVDEDLKALKEPLYVTGYYLSNIMLVWPLVFFGLGLIITCVTPESCRKINFNLSFFRTVILVYVFFHWPTWARNTIFSREDRKVISYANLDVSPIAFLLNR